MIEYIPWAKKTLDYCIQSQKAGFIPTLDIELTAKCSRAFCIYCDSKPTVSACEQKGEVDFFSLKKVILEAKEHGLKWIYTCGLGEPLEDMKFWDILYLLKENNIELSMFSNGIFIKDIYIAKELKKHNVNIILKMDTFDEKNFDIILGGKGISQKIFSARDYLLEAGYGAQNGYTNLAFSIVPTQLSLGGISKVIDYCEKNGIFASIGELEQAGEVLSNNLNDVLAINSDEVRKLKKYADAYAKGYYMRPICPCILTGLHIDNLGNCIVDKNTGLNCKWFLLKDPETIQIGDIYNDSVCELNKRVQKYRRKQFSENLVQIKRNCDVSYVFGGCGGNPKDIIDIVMSEYE